MKMTLNSFYHVRKKIFILLVRILRIFMCFYHSKWERGCIVMWKCNLATQNSQGNSNKRYRKKERNKERRKGTKKEREKPLTSRKL